MRAAAVNLTQETPAPTPRERAATRGVFSTEDLTRHLQFEAWRARVGALIDLTPVGDPREGYVASNRLWDLESMAMSQVVAPPARLLAQRGRHPA
jgi:hypothetical protein